MLALKLNRNESTARLLFTVVCKWLRIGVLIRLSLVLHPWRVIKYKEDAYILGTNEDVCQMATRTRKMCAINEQEISKNLKEYCAHPVQVWPLHRLYCGHNQLVLDVNNICAQAQQPLQSREEGLLFLALQRSQVSHRRGAILSCPPTQSGQSQSRPCSYHHGAFWTPHRAWRRLRPGSTGPKDVRSCHAQTTGLLRRQ